MMGKMSRFNQSRHGFSVMFPFSVTNPDLIKPIVISPENNIFEISNGLLGLGENVYMKIIYKLEEDSKVKSV
jgi:hypothetical protein